MLLNLNILAVEFDFLETCALHILQVLIKPRIQDVTQGEATLMVQLE